MAIDLLRCINAIVIVGYRRCRCGLNGIAEVVPFGRTLTTVKSGAGERPNNGGNS